MSLEPRSGLCRRDPLAAVLGLSVVVMLGIAAAQDQRAGCRLVPHDAPAVEEWACAISAGGPHFRVRVVPDSADDEGSYRILVLPEAGGTGAPGGGTPIQELPFTEEEPSEREPRLRMLDFDADGTLEVTAPAWFGATGNAGFTIWRFDVPTGRFVTDDSLSALTNPVPVPGRPCVRSRHGGGMAGMVFDETVHCRRARRWMLDSLAQQEWDAASRFFVRTTRGCQGDSLVMVRRDTIIDPAWRN